MVARMVKNKDRGIVQHEREVVSRYTPVNGEPKNFYFTKTTPNPRDAEQLAFLSAAEKVQGLYSLPDKEFHELVNSVDRKGESLIHTLYDGSTLETRVINN